MGVWLDFSQENIGGTMDFHRLVHEIDSEISRLQQARALLTGKPTKRGPGRPKASAAPHKLRPVQAASENVSAASPLKDVNALLTRCGSGGQNARNNKGPGKSRVGNKGGAVEPPLLRANDTRGAIRYFKLAPGRKSTTSISFPRRWSRNSFGVPVSCGNVP